MNDYLNINEVAEKLNITPTSVYKIVNHENPNKRLEPVNRTTYRGDGGYRFRREDVERMKSMYLKKDLTTSQAAIRIGRSKSFMQKLLHDEVIPYYEEVYRGKKTFFIKEEHLEEYLRENPDHGKHTIFDKKTGVFLYQPFKKDGHLARVIDMKRAGRNKLEILLQTGSETRFTYEKAIIEGWKPSSIIIPQKTNSTYGYARFEFPIPTTIDSMTYTVIEVLFKHVGPANIRITKNEKLIVEVKKSVLRGIMPITHPDIVDKLKMFLVSGEIIPKYDGILIDTGLSPITFYLPETKKTNLIETARKEGKSLQDWLGEKFT